MNQTCVYIVGCELRTCCDTSVIHNNGVAFGMPRTRSVSVYAAVEMLPAVLLGNASADDVG